LNDIVIVIETHDEHLSNLKEFFLTGRFNLQLW